MIPEGVQVQKVADVDVLHAERIRLVVRLLLRAGRVVVDLTSETWGQSRAHVFMRDRY